MLTHVTSAAQCNQIVQPVVTEITATPLMVHLQVLRRTTALAAPAISFEHSIAQYPVFLQIKPDSGLSVKAHSRTFL